MRKESELALPIGAEDGSGQMEHSGCCVAEREHTCASLVEDRQTLWKYTKDAEPWLQGSQNASSQKMTSQSRD